MADVDVIFFFSTIVASLSYTYFLSSNLPKGIYRLISLLPIFFLFTILPLRLSSAITTAVATFFFTWLANFKLLLFAFDNGPLHPPISFIQFIVIASLPVKIKPQFVNPKLKSSLNPLIESLIFPFLVNFAYYYKHKLNPHVLLIVYCFIIFIAVNHLVFVSNAVVGAVVAGVELEPPSNEPYLSTSLQDFWGRRWNLMATNSLRHTVYKPLKSVLPVNDWSTDMAVMATFVVSGLIHELLFYNISRVNPTWEMMSFFLVHGICLVVEKKVKRAVAGKFEFPAVVSRLFTVVFMFLTSFWLFFPPLIKSGAIVELMDSFKFIFDFMIDLFCFAVDMAATAAAAAAGEIGCIKSYPARGA